MVLLAVAGLLVGWLGLSLLAALRVHRTLDRWLASGRPPVQALSLVPAANLGSSEPVGTATRVVTGSAPFLYVLTAPLPSVGGHGIAIRVRGRLESGGIRIGIVSPVEWVRGEGASTIGPFEFWIVLSNRTPFANFVIANENPAGASRFLLEPIEVYGPL